MGKVGIHLKKKINFTDNHFFIFAEPVPTDELAGFQSQLESTSSELKLQ